MLSLKDRGSVRLLWLHADEPDAPLRYALIAWRIDIQHGVPYAHTRRRRAQLSNLLSDHHAMPRC